MTDGRVILAALVLCLAACAKPQSTPNFFYDEQGRMHRIETVPAGNKRVETLPVTERSAARYPGENPNNLTLAEMDGLREQLSRCWSIQAGARYSKDLKVEVRLTVSREREILSATIVDEARFKKDPYFRAAADSALRALNSEQCSPLQVNPSKYDQWKDMIITFDPSEMI